MRGRHGLLGRLLSGGTAPSGGDSGGENFAAAATYASEHGGLGFYALRGAEPVYEFFAPERDATTLHALASVSKSLCGLIAAAAITDGMLRLDELVADTVTEWAGDPRKSRIRVRDLLGMSSGLRFVPPPGTGFEPAVQLEAEEDPNTRFHYNGANYQVFGALMRRKLGGGRDQPLAYLQTRVLDPIGARIEDWRTAGDDPFLPGGGIASAENLGRIGALLLAEGHSQGAEIIPSDVLASLRHPSPFEPRYALSFWLLEGGYMAAGLGGQRIYVLPKRNLVIVRQARLFGAFGRGATFDDMIGGHGFEDGEFLRRLLG